MRLALLTACVLLLPTLKVQGAEDAATETEPAATESHISIAEQLVELLQRTADCLESCTTEETAAAALPSLQGLQDQAATLAAAQAALPEPTVQDYMAVQNRANDFLDAKKRIQREIQRMQKAGILTAEIRKILCIAPE